jgi:predicted esterase
MAYTRLGSDFELTLEKARARRFGILSLGGSVRHRSLSLLGSLIVLLLVVSGTVFDITRAEAAAFVAADQVSDAQYVAADPLPTYTFVPPPTVTGKPVRLMVVLHGMGGGGADMAAMLGPLAAQQNWALLAPTMPYRDYRDPELVRRDGELLPRLKSLIDALPARTGLMFQSRAVFFGFSRGSQEAIRYSLMFPDVTLGVAGLSAGSYTLPSSTDADGKMARYPFGVADVDTICGQKFDATAAKNVAYFIGVGGADTRSEDVPRQWDAMLGTNRVERAGRFVEILQQFGAKASLSVFAGAGHEVTGAMQQDAVRFLAGLGA